jgi:hypothetical protein
MYAPGLSPARHAAKFAAKEFASQVGKGLPSTNRLARCKTQPTALTSLVFQAMIHSSSTAVG